MGMNTLAYNIEYIYTYTHTHISSEISKVEKSEGLVAIVFTFPDS